MTSNGYSGTPLAKKLGIKSGASVLVINTPKPYLEFFHEFPAVVQFSNAMELDSNLDFIHIFVTKEFDLELYYHSAKPRLKKDGILWLSWPKKSSKIPTELDKTAIRE